MPNKVDSVPWVLPSQTAAQALAPGSGQRRAEGARKAPAVVGIEERTDRDAPVTCPQRDPGDAPCFVALDLQPHPVRIEAHFLRPPSGGDLAHDERAAADLD